MPQLPPDLQQIVDEIAAIDRAADAISESVTDQQFSWQPGGGTRWSIGQCLDHLAVINAAYTKALRTGVDGARERGWTRRGPSVPGVLGGVFVRSMEPPVKRRLRAPAGMGPSLRRSRDEILRAFHDSHAEFTRIVGDCAAIDTNRATFQNPFIKIVRVKVSTGLRVIPAHDRRHIWQAEENRKSLKSEV